MTSINQKRMSAQAFMNPFINSNDAFSDGAAAEDELLGADIDGKNDYFERQLRCQVVE
jgi:hypothetical protein